MLRLSAATITAAGLNLSGTELLADTNAHQPLPEGAKSYKELLRTWCDGLIAHQITAIKDPGVYGGMICPACGIIHGRCGDAVYPLLRMAHTTGESKYLQAALLVHEWSQQQVSRADGSWVNDVTLSSWQGITVFHSIALAEALEHHGEVLDTKTREVWTDRLRRAVKFLDGFITIETGNINYPVTSTHCFALAAKVLGEPKYTDRARAMAHEVLGYFTQNHLLAGEGHPLKGVSPKGCRPVDLGYNVEESLPSLVMYSQLTGDTEVRDATLAALRAHMEFMLPDGGWDNSWGTRNYKWTWWGSRTSDGCHPAYVLMADHDPRFVEVARRNMELMAACTHDGLLYGGPDYFAHGDRACVHHTFTHAKAIAAVLDRGAAQLQPSSRVPLPRDEAYGLKRFPEIGTSLIAVGDWRATVTDYDWEYEEHVQAGGGSAGGGHATGGALSVLYHRTLGPLLTASMTEYALIEISNQQTFHDGPHMCLTPRIELSAAGQTYTSLSDLAAVFKIEQVGDQVQCAAHGRLLTSAKKTVADGDVRYALQYMIGPDRVEIVGRADADHAGEAPLKFILPVISRTEEHMEADAHTVRITKPKGTVAVSVSGGEFAPIPAERTFNLVPGFECVPLEIPLKIGQEARIRLQVS
jgi:hypothetical protein